jgi:uncharacterized cupin superfamily protein
MSNSIEVIRLDPEMSMSTWVTMPLVGDLAEGKPPMERFNRVFETSIGNPCKVRAGIWQAEAYCEQVQDYPYDEIVFVVDGSISMIDDDGIEQRFNAGDCFFIPRGFCGLWKQHQTLKIFHMTVDQAG